MSILMSLVLGVVLASRVAALSRTSSVPIDQRLLANDSVLASLARPRDTTVVLLYRPADCFSCFGVLADWRQWQAEGGGALHLVLTRTPGPAQVMQLRLLGVTEFQLLREEVQLGFELPATLLFERGSLIAIAPVTPGRDLLLSHLRARSASQDAQAATNRVAVNTPH